MNCGILNERSHLENVSIDCYTRWGWPWELIPFALNCFIPLYRHRHLFSAHIFASCTTYITSIVENLLRLNVRACCSAAWCCGVECCKVISHPCCAKFMYTVTWNCHAVKKYLICCQQWEMNISVTYFEHTTLLLTRKIYFKYSDVSGIFFM